MASQIHARSPQTRVVYRLACPEIINEYIMSDFTRPEPPAARARWFIAQFADEVRPYVERGEISYIETPMYEMMVYRHIENIINFEYAFIAELERALPQARPLVAAIAVGEPNESKYPLLLPLARKVAQVGGAFGYHAFWPVEEGRSLLKDEWRRYAGRFEAMDAFFRYTDDVQVDWLLSECGPCGVIRDTDFDDEILDFIRWSGWRHPQCFGGDWDAARADINAFRHLLSSSPAHVVGAALFTVCSYCWGEEYPDISTFNLSTEELATLTL